jgi:RNA polymerase sigma-70 factor, ECF subfamily
MSPQEATLVAAVHAGDESAFSVLAERHRRELHVHCYRMLGSVQDAEDAVQEAFLRAWRSRASFQSRGATSFRSWLYRIATNTCLDTLERSGHRRRLLAFQLGPPADPSAPPPPPADRPWLQPYPDALLQGVAPGEEEPEAVVVARETIELTFLAALQMLPARQRAVLILRDVLGWSAKDTAMMLDMTVASANSALQRARGTLQEQLPARRAEWTRVSPRSAEERAVLKRFMEAFERSDLEAVAEMLSEEVRTSMPPYPMWFDGRDDNLAAMSHAFDPASPWYVGEWKCVPTGANLQPAAAFYVRRPGDSEFRAFAIDVLRIEDGKVAEITAFDDALFPVFGLPATL